MTGLPRIAAVILSTYALFAIGMLRWHTSHGSPYTQTTLGLLGVFAVCGALVGLLSVWAAHGMLHWSKRMSGLVAAVSILTGLWLLFFDWNRFLIWQMIVLLAVQLACLVFVLGFFRAIGLGILHNLSTPDRMNELSRLSIYDLLVLTAAFALFFTVMRTAQPIALTGKLYMILVAGGICAAFAALTAFWVSFSNSSLFLRLSVFAIVAPIGGAVYAIASQYEALLFNWQWYAGVTSLQMLLMVLPFTAVRLCGFRFPVDKLGV